jgi:hypothetical protein
MLDESLRVTRRPKPGGQLFLMCFSGYGVKKKRLMHTVAMQKPNEIESLGKSRRLRGSGRDLGVYGKRSTITPQSSRICRAGHNREGNLVFQFSSGLCSSRLFYNPLSDILGRATLKLPRVGVPKADKAPKPIRGWVGRDIARQRV